VDGTLRGPKPQNATAEYAEHAESAERIQETGT
jgi:hypothetical protein